jgi:hypothetical protein
MKCYASRAADLLSASAAGPPELRQSGKEPGIVFIHLMEGISLAMDLRGGRMFITDFRGSVYSRQSRWVEPEDGAVCGRKPDRHGIRGGAVRILSRSTPSM